jgi:hypothetical protein
MCKKVFKYSFEINDVITLDLPKDSEILSAQIQNGIPCMWVLVEEKAPLKKRTFKLFNTGVQIKEPGMLDYVATIQNGAIVFHIFEELIKH